ncbi:hypothetical protein EGW08_022331 [Elysia chlorotica]|uniref:Uncharacterized protein n=1 Tax=Elysia chlorotica TaxID=188477 RepID=A0A433SL83_ELYCH|nr:hypothetical protein EGW08_022331 [Elysia chlorotica]
MYALLNSDLPLIKHPKIKFIPYTAVENPIYALLNSPRRLRLAVVSKMWIPLLTGRASILLVMLVILLPHGFALTLPDTYKAIQSIANNTEEEVTRLDKASIAKDATDKENNTAHERVRRHSPTPFDRNPFSPPRTVHYYSVSPSNRRTQVYNDKSRDSFSQRQYRTANPLRKPDEIVVASSHNENRDVTPNSYLTRGSSLMEQRQDMTTKRAQGNFDGYTHSLHPWAEQRQQYNKQKTGGSNQNVAHTTRRVEYPNGDRIEKPGSHLDLGSEKPAGKSMEKTLPVGQSPAKTMMTVISEMRAAGSGKEIQSDNYPSTPEPVMYAGRLEGDSSAVVEPDSYQGELLTKPRPPDAGSQEAPADATLGLLTSHPHGLYKRTLQLKEKNRDLKILLAVGGWKIGSKPFLPVIQNSSTWRTWITNVIEYLRRFGFDGLDMDWEFPGWRGSGPEDRHKFTLFMKDIHDAFAGETEVSGKPKLILTLAAASSAFYVEKSYEAAEIHKYVDYILLMTYNFHGSGWEKYTGHHTPLLPHPLDPEGEQRELYVVRKTKLTTGVRAPADGGNTKGKYTEESGILSHYEICEHVIQDGWTVEWIDEQKAPYAHGQGEWVGFDSPDSFYIKAVTVLQEGLAGAFIWSVEMDDFNGHCGGPKFPLIRTVYEVFTQHPLSSSSPSTSAQLRVVSNTAQGQNTPINSAAATHSNPGDQETSARQGSITEDSSSSSQTADHQYEHEPDADGHLSKPWQALTDYDYEYYHWDDDSGSEIHEHVDCNDMGLGIHSAPHSCHHFVLCMPINGHDLGPSLMACPSGTLFDDSLKVCNHRHLVRCHH